MNAEIFRPCSKARRLLLSVSLAVVAPTIHAQKAALSDSDLRFSIGVNSFPIKILIDGEDGKFLATVIDGTEKTIDSSYLPDSYSVRNEGKLNVVDGAVVESVLVENSTLNVADSSVTKGIVTMTVVSQSRTQ